MPDPRHHPRKMIRLDGITFFVTYDHQGAISILQRDIKFRGKPWECIYDRCLWHRSHKQPKFRTQPGSKTRRVLAKFEAEQRETVHG